MKNKINKYFFQQFSHYFAIVLFALVAIVWIAQAVNYLDLVIDDGHAFTTYFTYSLLTIPKITTRLLPFCFLVTLILTILRLEKDNELIVMWTSGLNKMKLVNLIFMLSIIITIIQFILASTITPASLNLSRSLLKNSSLDFFPSLIKEKSFNDAVKDLTIFVEKKSIDGLMENIFIRDENKILKDKVQKSSTIFAKQGFLKQDKNQKHLILYEGTIQKENSNGKINFIKFEKINLSLNNIMTQSITMPKIQETSSFKLLYCSEYFKLISYDMFLSYKLFFLKKNKYKEIIFDTHNCDKNNKSILIELNRRFGMPFYIPVISLVGSFLLSSKQESKKSKFNKYIYFILGFFILIFAEIFTRYSGNNFYVILYYAIPLAIMPLIYLVLIKTFKYENLK